ncbi:type IV conjugative transfer system protein TraL [Methylococcus capsulatus]|uniref:type IV conjugative transfer system protein TraL n=1 Tax=Methylococcus capsulatus TaxID=414 RepID=UPI001C53145E|nr:type IV conjugative transfer system protein TraL [Methylococcus capsulatus]QXP89487.1 type IV conjugative transfer system protein TraL [Methylococcus capsulatus]
MKAIPNYLDDPEQVLLWEIDEFLILSTLFAVGLMINYLAVCLFVGYLLMRIYRRSRDSRGNGFVIHAAYWFLGIGAGGSHSVPMPFILRWFP